MAEAPQKDVEQARRDRRKLQVDLSGLDAGQRYRRSAIIALGQTAFGDLWRTALAEALSAELGKTLSQSQLAQWISGTRPVPEPVFVAAAAVAIRLAHDLDLRARILATGTWKDSRDIEGGRVAVPEPATDAPRGEDDA